MNLTTVSPRLLAERGLDATIVPGALVRSYDFKGDDSSYIEGQVMRIVENALDRTLRYEIQVSGGAIAGLPIPRPPHAKADFVYPPVNGTYTFGGRTTNGVQVIGTPG